MSADPDQMLQYLQLFGNGGVGSGGAGWQRQTSNVAAANVISPMVRALMLARMRDQQQKQLQPVTSLQSQMMSPFAGGTGSNVAPGAGDPSLGAAMAAGVS